MNEKKTILQSWLFPSNKILCQTKDFVPVFHCEHLDIKYLYKIFYILGQWIFVGLTDRNIASVFTQPDCIGLNVYIWCKKEYYKFISLVLYKLLVFYCDKYFIAISNFKLSPFFKGI